MEELGSLLPFSFWFCVMLTAFTPVAIMLNTTLVLAGLVLSGHNEILRKHITHGLGAARQVWSLLIKDHRPEGGPSSNLTCPFTFCLIHVPCNQFAR